MVYSHPLYGRVHAALLTGRKQFPFRETIKIKLSVNCTKVTACNLITPEMRVVNPTVYHLIQKEPESQFTISACSILPAPASVLLPEILLPEYCKNVPLPKI